MTREEFIAGVMTVLREALPDSAATMTMADYGVVHMAISNYGRTLDLPMPAADPDWPEDHP